MYRKRKAEEKGKHGEWISLISLIDYYMHKVTAYMLAHHGETILRSI